MKNSKHTFYKLTQNGYRITKNGNVIDSIEKEAIKEDVYLGLQIKEDGTYYFFDRKQGSTYIYLP
jgi:zona occludens toxin (predicted ATPase)